MINAAMKTNGTMDRNSILSLNIPEPQSVKSQNNIMTLIKNPKSGSSCAAHVCPAQYVQSPGRQSQESSLQPPQYGSSQSRPSQRGPLQSRPPQQPQNIQPALTAGQQNTVVTPAMPDSRQIPTLINKVQKGQKITLSADAVNGVNACFGWNVKDTRCDVDVSAFLLGANGKVIGDSWFVFYGQTLSPDQSTKFAASHSADREMIQIDFKRLNPQVKKIVFVLTINDALTNRLHFGMLKDAYVRIMDTSGKELVSFMMTDYYSNVISMMIGELYQYNGAWKFNAVGNGVAKDLAGLCALYGVQIV